MLMNRRNQEQKKQYPKKVYPNDSASFFWTNGTSLLNSEL